jgi:hypothetical protein
VSRDDRLRLVREEARGPKVVAEMVARVLQLGGETPVDDHDPTACEQRRERVRRNWARVPDLPRPRVPDLPCPRVPDLPRHARQPASPMSPMSIA